MEILLSKYGEVLKADSKMYMEIQKTPKTNTVLKEKNKVGELTLP